MGETSHTSATGQGDKESKSRRGSRGYFRFGIAVLILLLTIGASVALADEEPGPQGGPSVSQVIEAIEDPSIPAAEMPSTDSQAAASLPHQDLNREQANELLTEVFGTALESPASIFDELDVLKFYSDNVALLEGGDQPHEKAGMEPQPTLLESTLPLRAEAVNGDQAPVDLGLEKKDGEIQPANPLVEVEIPSQIEEGISLPEADIRIELDDAPADHAPSIIDQSVASYPNVAEDTTFVVAPTPTGIETFTLLQSAAAPTSQTFHLDLPAGAVLTETDDGGAEVSSNGEILMAVLPPSAIDAAEAPVPVHLETKGDSITVAANPGQESQYPILVDPMWETYYWLQKTTTTFEGWNSFSNSPVFTTSHNGRHEGIWDPGLQIGSGNTAISPGAQARWDYRVPRFATDINSEGKSVRPTSFITRVIYSKLFFDVQAADNKPLWNDPFFAFYIWDESYQGFVAIGHRFGLEGNLSNMNYEYNLYNTAPPNENVNAKQTSLELVSHQTKSQYRQLYVGLAGVELSDKDYPGLAPVEPPEDWLHATAKPIYFEAVDTGLGLREMTVTQPSISGGTQTFKTTYKAKSLPVGCSGGNMAPCPRDWKSTTGPAIAYDPATMPQGENTVVVDAVDPLGQWATKNPGAKSGLGKIHIWVDHTTPDLALSGPLTEQGKLGTSAAEYALSYSATDGDAQAPSATSYVGSLGTGDGKLQRPQGVALDGEGNVWVVDKNNYRIQKFDKNGKFLLKVGSQGTGPGQFSDTRSIAVTNNGTVWVSEINGRLQAFNSNGGFIRQIHQDVLNQAVGIAPAPGGMLWVADPGAGRVYKVNETTGALPSYVSGSAGNPYGPANLPYPSGLAADGMGGVWVADPVNDRIQKFDASGKFVTQFGVSGKGPGQLDGTLYIAVARSGNLLVTDEFSNRVQVFRPDGTFLREFGATGSGNGQFTEVRGIAVNSSNEAFVADAGNGRVHKWSHADLDKQSGVVSTEVKVDGQAVEPKYAPGCPTENCAINKAWTLKAIDYASGQHNVQVTATDGVGLSTTKSLTITTAKDTAGPQLTANNSFYAAPEGWLDQETYSYSASASDATYGVTSFSLKVDGKVISSKTQSCSSGGCGASISGSINMATYEGGAHPAELIATDAGGNTTKKAWTINVNPEGTVSAAEAVATLEAVDGTSKSTVVAPTDETVDPAEQEAGNDPALQKEGEVLESTGTANPATIAVDPSGGFTVESSVEPLHVEPVSTGEDSTPMIVTEEVAATSANSAANVDTVIRPVFNGVFDYQAIRDTGAPEQYSWKVKLGKGQMLKVYDDQYAAVEYENGDITYAIIAEPAHDAIGTTIKTSFSVTGNIVTLTIPHKAQKYVYPIVSGVGWEGGFTTTLAVMPPPEKTGTMGGMQTYAVVSPPEPAGYGDPDDATASSIQTFIKKYGYFACATVINGDCPTWRHRIKGFFFYNGRKAWWKDRDPVCEHDQIPNVTVAVNYCNWIGPNHQRYGDGYHITSQTRFEVTENFIVSQTDAYALTVRMFGSGGWYGHPTDKVCNPSRPDC